jgi:hypothetical protein
MGLEAQCQARFGTKAGVGKARLEATELRFDGAFRLRIPVPQIRSAEAKSGQLEVRFADGVARFELGAQAEKWALKIRYPRGLMEKLGVKPGLRVWVQGVDDPDFHRQLEERGVELKPRARSGVDLVFWAPRSRDELGPKLTALRGVIKPAGAIWVVWPKGQKALREDDVRAVGKQVGLVDVKVVSFSERLSALKMVIPIHLR